MSEFDPLLEQVLGEEANVEPPGGMKRRLASAIAGEASDRASVSASWRMAGAAAVLIALIGAQALNHRSSMAGPLAERDGRVSSTVGKAIASEAVILKFPPPPPPRPAHSGHRKMGGVANRIAPIEVDRLVVPPIEVASLTSNSPASRGETR